MSRRALILLVSLASILAVISVYFGFYGKNNKQINTKTEAATSSKTLTSQAEWTAGTNTNTDLAIPGAIKIDNKILQESIYTPTNYTISAFPEAGSGSLLDGDLCTYWSDPDPYYPPNYLQIDIGSIQSLKIVMYDNAGASPREVFISSNGVSWSTINDMSGNGTLNNCGGSYNTFELIGSIGFHSFRYFKTTMQTGIPPLNYQERVSELKFYQAIAQGVHTSSPTQLDGGTSHFKNWTTFVPTDTIPASTSVNFRFRTSADAGTWGSWTASTASAASIDISSLLGATDAAKRYLQVETTLANTDGASTPTLDAYTANYDYAVLDHITVTPDTPSIVKGGTQAFTASAIDDSSNPITGAAFSYSATGGTIDGSGNYTAPATAGTYTVTVSSTVDGVTKTHDVTVTVITSTSPLNHLTVTPGSATIATGGTQSFVAAAIGDDGNPIAGATFSYSATGGTIDGSGNYTAPATAGTYTVTVSSTVDGVTKTYDVLVTVTAGTGGGGGTEVVDHLTITPGNINLTINGSHTFAAKLYKDDGSLITDGTVAWTTSGGTIIDNGDDSAGWVAPAAPGTYTVTASAGGKSISATIIVSAFVPALPPTPPVADNCTLGGVASVTIQPPTFALAPGESKSLGINFSDAAGNSVDKNSVTGFKITPDNGNSFWDIAQGGGRFDSENTLSYNINFIAGGTRGTFDKTIVFSACNGNLKAFASSTINKQTTIYAQVDPGSYALQPGENRDFTAILTDDTGAVVTESCNYSWSLSDQSAVSFANGNTKTTKITANDKVGEYTVKVDVSCPSGNASATARLAIVKIDANTRWRLINYFPSLDSWVGQKTYVGFIPQLQAGSGGWYSRNEKVDLTISDQTAATIVGTHPYWQGIPVVLAAKAGCYPFLVQATLNEFGKSYSSATSMNIGSNGVAPPLDKYQPTLGTSALIHQHLVKVSKEIEIDLQRNNSTGDNYPWYNWIYYDKPMTTTWALNDTRAGSLRPYNDSAYLDTTNAEYGYFPRAITTIVKFNGQTKVENWDIWIEHSSDKITFSPSLPTTITVKPNTYFSIPWHGYNYVNWQEHVSGSYIIDSVNANAATLINNSSYILLKSGPTEGTFTDAIALRSIFGTSAMSGDIRKKITIMVDINAPTDACFGNNYNPPSPFCDSTSDPNCETLPGPIVGPICVGSFCVDTPPWIAGIIDGLNSLLSTLSGKLELGFLALAALLALIAQFLGYIPDLQSLFAKGRDKKHAPGIVYDAVNGLPIPDVIVMLFRTRDKKLIKTVKSDKNGRFALETPLGEEYYVETDKDHKIINQNSNILEKASLTYADNYFQGEIIRPDAENDRLALAIPVELTNELLENQVIKSITKRLSISAFLRLINYPILVIGLIFTILATTKTPSAINFIILAFYILVFVIYLLRYLSSGHARGYVVSSTDKMPLDLAIVRAIDTSSKKIIQTSTTGEAGSFNLSLPKGSYKLIVTKPGFQMAEQIEVHAGKSLEPIKTMVRMNNLDISNQEPAIKQYENIQPTENTPQQINFPTETINVTRTPVDLTDIIERHYR